MPEACGKHTNEHMTEEHSTNNIVIQINLEDIVEGMFEDAETREHHCEPSSSFKEAVQHRIIAQVVQEVKKAVTDTAIQQAALKAQTIMGDFIKYEMEGLVNAKLRTCEVATRYGAKNLDELVAEKLNAVSVEEVIRRHVDAKAKTFGDEMKLRYDNIFAARIVEALNKQNMLNADVAKLLLGEQP